MRFYYWVYTILAVLAFLLALPYMMVRMLLTGRYREAFWQMLGFWPQEAVEKLDGKGCIWIHAVSVGEAVAASAIIKELRKICPQEKIMVSAATETGQRMARKIIEDADLFIYFPLDYPWLARKALKLFRPKLFVMVETELWPNFLRQSKKAGVTNLMVNGRISDKSLRQYRRLDKFFGGIFQDMLSKLTFFSMQSEVDSEHILALGADPKKVLVTGNTKFDQSYGNLTQGEKIDFLKQFGLAEEQPIFVVGSTHKGEEEAVLECFREIKKQYPDYRMILAPRHLPRVGEVENLCLQSGFNPVRRTGLPENKDRVKDIIILDTIGELGKVYGLGEIVYVGGSLVATGGHNLLEPAAQGKPIFFGPHMDNFKETTQLVLTHQAGVQVPDQQELTKTILEFLAEPEKLKIMGQAAWQMVEENKGASQKNAQIIQSFLPQELISVSGPYTPLEEYLLAVVMGKRKGLEESLIFILLNFLSCLYQGAIALLLAAYTLGVKKRSRLPGKVISIGNITVGGTGKTPTTQMLARMLQNWGIKVAILNRGYRSSFVGQMAVVSDGKKIHLSAQEAGDEAYMLAQSLPGVPVLIGRNRVATGSYAFNELGVQTVILDDGYQYWELEKDLEIVLIDMSNPFSNGKVLPAGLLREPLKNLQRADLFFLSKTNYTNCEEKKQVKEILANFNQSAPILELSYRPEYLREFNSGQIIRDLRFLANKRILAVSGLSNPDFFESMLEHWGPAQLEKLRFPNHYTYTLDDLNNIREIYQNKKLDLVVATEKDAVSIPADWQANFPFWILDIEVKPEATAEVQLKEMILQELKSGKGEAE